MFVLRGTQKLRKRLKMPVSPSQAGDTVLGDWYADLRPVRPKHLVLLVNDRTRFPVLVHASPLTSLQPRFCIALSKQLCAIGAADDAIDAEMARMDTMRVDKTASRSVLATMMDYRFMLEAYMDGGPPHDLHAVSMKMALGPCGPLDMESPIDVTRSALNGA
ncbi:MAG: hypothetical protein AAF938_01455 [Myxococcota bacterium]